MMLCIFSDVNCFSISSKKLRTKVGKYVLVMGHEFSIIFLVLPVNMGVRRIITDVRLSNEGKNPFGCITRWSVLFFMEWYYFIFGVRWVDVRIGSLDYETVNQPLPGLDIQLTFISLCLQRGPFLGDVIVLLGTGMNIFVSSVAVNVNWYMKLLVKLR
jgi:hypothetical protein